MAFCKVCICGEKIVFQRIMSFPDNCPSCGRKLMDFQTYSEDDPHVEELMKGIKTPDVPEEKPVLTGDRKTLEKTYALKLGNGNEIVIPAGGCIIGRTETGAEELAEFASVSRQHLRVIPKRNIGIIIEDLSSYGTLVDGQRIVKNSPVRVAEGSKITLCDLEALLIVKEGDL